MTTQINFAPAATSIQVAKKHLQTYDWNAFTSELSNHGCAVLKNILTPQECKDIAGLYPHEENFRSHIHMARHGFGRGEYRYFKYPLPDLISGLRTAL